MTPLNKTSQAVENNEGYSSLRPAEWFCIRQKFKRMEQALEAIAHPGELNPVIVAKSALAFDPLSN